MVVPAHAVGKVMGKGGANIENIRKVGFFPFLEQRHLLSFYFLLMSDLGSCLFQSKYFLEIIFQVNDLELKEIIFQKQKA